MNKTGWHNDKICQHILSTNFPKLRDSNHFTAINMCMNKIDSSLYPSILDIGCCKAELAVTFPYFQYTGADLPNIIEGVSKKIRPGLAYIYFNAETDNYEVINNRFDVIVMNSFLSEISDPLSVLDKVLKSAKKYIIIHRQDISDKEAIEQYQTYGGLNATNSTICRQDLERLIKENNCKIALETNSFDETIDTKRTLLIEKND
jgi:SAM-dependent methyltransferase